MSFDALGPVAIALIAVVFLLAGFMHGALGFGFPLLAVGDGGSAGSAVRPWRGSVESPAMKAIAFWLALLAAGCALAQSTVESPEHQLFRAIEEGKSVFAEGIVLGRRVDLEARNDERETPLHRAVERAMKPLVQVLVSAGASQRARSQNGETPLHYAALHADPEYAELLLRAGADARARNDDGESVLMWAALTGNQRTAQALLDAGADADVADLRGNRPLHAAADGGFEALVRLLAARSRDPRARNREGDSAADLARKRGFDKIAAFIDQAIPGAAPPGGSR